LCDRFCRLDKGYDLSFSSAPLPLGFLNDVLLQGPNPRNAPIMRPSLGSRIKCCTPAVCLSVRPCLLFFERVKLWKLLI